MRIAAKPALGIMILCLSASVCPGQSDAGSAPPSTKRPAAKASRARKPTTLNADDGLSVIAAALDPKVRRYAGHDCSHLVHAIYDHAGFPYTYASSSDIYEGVAGFQRIYHPQTGDLVVWPGHVGIVVQPSRHVFFSFKTAGPGIDDYEAPYWVGRGQARFYRYLKTGPCSGCAFVSKSLPHPAKLTPPDRRP